MTKDKARAAVKRALHTGKLVRPNLCEECSLPGPQSSDGRSTIHAHHHRGYEHPLNVKWMCPTCHFKYDPRPSRERNGRAVLTEQQVGEIRARYRRGPIGGGRHFGPSSNSARGLAREFGVHNATILRIIHKENWIDAALGEKP